MNSNPTHTVPNAFKQSMNVQCEHTPVVYQAFLHLPQTEACTHAQTQAEAQHVHVHKLSSPYIEICMGMSKRIAHVCASLHESMHAIAA